MNNIKSEFVNAIMISLKIEKNPFIVSTIDEFTSNIKPTEYKSFMTALFGNQHAYLNGIDRVAKVAEQFKPSIQDNSMELKAKELILWCETANSTIFDNAKKSGRTFEDELKGTKFISLSDSDMSVLNQVKPYMSHKELINNIRVYQTSKDTLSAFMDALKYKAPDSQMITNPIQNLRIKR